VSHLILTSVLLAASAGVCDPADPPLVMTYGSPDGAVYSLDRQAVIGGRTDIDIRLSDACKERYRMRWFALTIGSEALCMVNGPDQSCVVDFGSDLNSWSLTLKTSLADSIEGGVIQSERSLLTLDAGLRESDSRRAVSGSGMAMQERADAQRVPHDTILRTALVLDRKGEPRAGLTASDFELSVAGVDGEKLIDVRPMSEVEDSRLLFMMLDVSDYVTKGKKLPVWRPEYRSFVDAVVHSLGKVIGSGRKLLLVRYAASAESSPLVALDEEGIRSVASWLLTPPLPSWKRGTADRTAALLGVYDLHLHDFAGQPLGLIVSGGRNNLSEDYALVAEERFRELNPVWSEEKLSALVTEMDFGHRELFSHTEQRGFPLSWVYVPSTSELTHSKFLQTSEYFYGYGGETYRLATIRHTMERVGNKAPGGTLHLDDVLLAMFEDLESSYLLRLRIPNPVQKRTERRIKLKVDGSIVRTQEFYHPSASLRSNIERYLASSSKERRLRAAYVARNYPLDGRIYRKVLEWLPEEPSPQLLPILEESALLMHFKRAQSEERKISQPACDRLLGIDHAAVAEGNRALLSRLQELAGTVAGCD
jgi:hypothetical protein